jgi:hypothetical protein
MFKTCKHCNKKFDSIKTCKRHLEKRICLKRIEKKWQKMKEKMKICKRCGLVLSSQYSLDKHLTKQVPCAERDLKNSLYDLQQEYYDKDIIGRKKFQLKKELLCENLDIDIVKNNLDITLTEKPNIIYNKKINFEEITNEELIIIIKEQVECLNKVSKWVDLAWLLLKEVSPENIEYTEKKEISSVITPIILNDNEEKLPENENKNKNKNELKFINNDKIIKEKIEWDNLLNNDEKTFNPLENILHGYWNSDNYILNPVRHYADFYPRPLIVRNMKSVKMLTSIICPNFYPNYKSSLDTKVYINANRKKKLWLRDDNDKWHSLDFSVGFKNMIFHAISAYIDIIRREKELLPEKLIETWEVEKDTLQNQNDENYKIIKKNLIDRIPKLLIHPEEEEKRLSEIYLSNNEYKIDILTELSEEIENFNNLSQENQNKILYKRVIHNIRYNNKLLKAKKYHDNVNEYYKNIYLE